MKISEASLSPPPAAGQLESRSSELQELSLLVRGGCLEVEPELIATAGGSPLQALYVSSKQGEEHFEGGDVTDGMRYLLSTINVRHTFPVLGCEQHGARIESVYNWVRQLVAAFPEVEGVVFFGSALMGKQSPSDFDFYVVLRQGDTPICDHDLLGFKDRVAASHAVPRLIEGVEVSLAAVASYEDHETLRLRFVERGPFLAMVPLPDEMAKQIAPIFPLQVFLNTGGDIYMSTEKYEAGSG